MKNEKYVHKISELNSASGHELCSEIEKSLGLNIQGYQQRWGRWSASIITSLLLLLTGMSAYGASTFPSNLVVDVKSKGSIVWRGLSASNIDAFRSLSSQQTIDIGGGIFFNCVSSYGCNGWVTVDGYVGIPIADNILIVLEGEQNASAAPEGGASFAYEWKTKYSLTPHSIPTMVTSGGDAQRWWQPTMTTSIVTPPGTSGPHIYQQPSSPPYVNTNLADRYSYMMYLDVRPSLYVGKRAKAGTYSLPNSLYASLSGVNGRYPYPSMALTYLLAGGSVTVRDMSCTISAPPTIDFGTIHGVDIKENSYIAQKTGNLNINCNGDAQDITSVKVQVLGATEGYSYILPLYNDSKLLAPGEVRGWINRPEDQTCSGFASATNGLYFGDSSKWYSGGELKGGNNTIPYVFNLCGSGKNQAKNLGHASATATVNVSWD